MLGAPNEKELSGQQIAFKFLSANINRKNIFLYLIYLPGNNVSQVFSKVPKTVKKN